MPQHIIHIGFPKAGSTFLQHYFSEHPDIDYDRMDFDYYRSTGKIDFSIMDKKVDTPFRVLSEEELSVSAAHVQKVGVEYQAYDIKKQTQQTAEDLKEMFPNAKVIIITRGYKSLIPSIYSQFLMSGGRYNFSNFIQKFGSLFAHHYHYDYIYELYVSVFGLENVLILPYELLRKDAKYFLKTIETFCGWNHLDFNPGGINRSLSPQYIPWVLFSSRMVYQLSKILPKKAQQKLYFHYKNALIRYKNAYFSSSKKSKPKNYDNDMKVVLHSFVGTYENILKTKHFEGFESYYQTNR